MANIYSIQKGTKAFTWKEAKNSIRVAQNVTFGADAVSSTVLYRMLSIGFKPGTGDTNNKLAITMEKYVPEVVRKPKGFTTTNAFASTHAAVFTEAGTLIAHGITSLTTDTWGTEYSGSVACELGQVKAMSIEGGKVILYNINGTKKMMNFSVGAGVHEMRGDESVADYTLDNVTWKAVAEVPGVPAGTTTITKYITISGSSAEDEEVEEEVEGE